MRRGNVVRRVPGRLSDVSSNQVSASRPEFVILTRETLMIRPSTFTDSRRAVARPPRTQVGQHVDIKTVREQRCSSATAPYGEHLKRTALVRTERHGFGNITCPAPWRERAVAPG